MADPVTTVLKSGPFQKVAGPAENLDAKWRTTNTHTPQQMMSVYCEIFFAGFPKTSSGQEGRVSFPEGLVKDFFSSFGPIVAFKFDARDGVGAVVFEDGEDAERCYVSSHLSILRGHTSSSSSSSYRSANDELSRCETIDDDEADGHDIHAKRLTEDDQAVAIRTLHRAFGARSAMLYLEFAQFLPFVNPLLVESSLAPLTMSRQMLRTFPVCERQTKLGPVHDFVVYRGRQQRQASSAASTGAEYDHITFPGSGNPRDVPTSIAMIEALYSSFSTSGFTHKDVTALQLWSQYYSRFVVRKTEPQTGRILNKSHMFASKPSALQDVCRFLEQEMQQGGHDGRSISSQMARFLEDDVLHSTLAYWCLKLRLGYDPSLVSYLREIETLRRSKSSGGKGDGGSTNNRNSIAAASVNAALDLSESAVSELLKRPIVAAAQNVIDNAWSLYQPKIAPSTSSHEAKEDAKFRSVLQLFDAYAASGSASAMAAISADPNVFRSPSGLMGSLPTLKGMLWKTLRLPLAFIVALIAVLLVTIHVF